jgi:hypothetical protein
MSSQTLDQLEEWIKEKPIPYISNDKFSQEDIFHYWAVRLPGHGHVNQTYPDHGRWDVETVPWLPWIWRWDRASLLFSLKTA